MADFHSERLTEHLDLDTTHAHLKTVACSRYKLSRFKARQAGGGRGMFCIAAPNHRGLLMIRAGRRCSTVLGTITSGADREDCGSHSPWRRALCSSAAAAAVAVMHLIGKAQDLSPTILP